MNVLAIDPGGTTGWAAWSQDAGFSCGQIPGGIDGAAECGGLIYWGGGGRGAEVVTPDTRYAVTHLVIERYTIGERTVKFSRQSDALEITGLLKGVFAAVGTPTIQLPKDAMRIFTDERLKAKGWYAPGQQHARDAARHLGLFLAKNHIIRLTD